MFEEDGECRTCLSKGTELLPINAIIENEISVVDCFNECMKIEINESDNLPQVICLTCLDHILEVRKFYLQIINAENYFKQRIQIVDNVELKPIAIDSIIKIESIQEASTNPEEYVVTDENNDDFIEYEASSVKEQEIDVIEANENDFCCNHCNEVFKYEKNYKLHLRLDHNENITTIDKDDNVNKNENQDKSSSEKLKTKYRCSICDFPFKFRTNFINHMKRHKAKKEISCKCPNSGCDQEFYEAESLHQHIKRYHTGDDNSLLCPYCGQTFTEKKQFKRHVETHNINRIRKIKCRFCGKLFSDKYLKSHERKHTGERPYKCPYCEKRFKTSSVLKTHVMYHTGKPLQCPVCEKRFTRKGFLAVHMRSHTQERPFVCHICTQSYKHKCHLQAHMNLHTFERNFACDICGTIFFKRELLRRHRFSHVKIKPYKCPECSLETASTYWFRKHLQRAHNIFDDVQKYKRDIEGALKALKESQNMIIIGCDDENVEIVN